MTILPAKERNKWVRQVLDGIRSYRRGLAVKWLSDLIEEQKEFEIVGFAANFSYVNLVGSKTCDPKAVYLHKWETPALLLKHRRLPIVIMTSPSVRLNDTILREQGNLVPNVEGFTG
jgi:hypothetical protein